MARIYLHGLGQTPDSWRETLALSGTAGDSVCPDLAAMVRGREATYDRLYAAFAAYCDRWDGPVDLCGLSLGAVLALHLATERPGKVRSLVLIAPQYRMPRALLRFQDLVFHIMPRSMFQGTGFSKDNFRRLCGTMAELDFRGDLGRVACPTAVVYGARDRANRRSARELADHIRGAQLHMVPGAGHEVNVEAPQALAEILRDFYGPRG